MFVGCGGKKAAQPVGDAATDVGMVSNDGASADAPAGSDRFVQADLASPKLDGSTTGPDTKPGASDTAGDASVLARDTSSADVILDARIDAVGDSRTPDLSVDSNPGKDTGVADTRNLGTPTFAVEMTKADQARFYGRATNGGSTAFGITNASAGDNNVAELTFKGNAALGPSDKLTPDFATEIGTNDATFGFGTYRTRVQLARCASSEELVNGIFTYFNDGKDHDGDGLIDNSEIDIEILCSDPSIISLTIWSEYTSDTAKRGVTRVIHTQTGAYEDTTDDQDSGHGSKPEFKLAGFPDPNAFYEMGFEWHADHIRYFIVVNGAELTLWTYTYAQYIPTLPAAFLFNVWHSTDWWSSRGTADYPASDATMRVDWFRYWKE
jgi:beta-glucanase (GH16 family)